MGGNPNLKSFKSKCLYKRIDVCKFTKTHQISYIYVQNVSFKLTY